LSVVTYNTISTRCQPLLSATAALLSVANNILSITIRYILSDELGSIATIVSTIRRPRHWQLLTWGRDSIVKLHWSLPNWHCL